MTHQYVRETSDQEQRANARRKVEEAAKQGELPSQAFEAADLRWAYEGRGDELAELEEQAKRAHDKQERLAADPPHLRGLALRTETDNVLAEWDAQRRREAQAEARRRLGMDDA